jgi:photosystem II stability/assembly factor-like uncharacterized protein
MVKLTSITKVVLVLLIIVFHVRTIQAQQVDHITISNPQMIHIGSVIHKDALTWLAYGIVALPPDPFPDYKNTMIKTTDGGITWTEVYDQFFKDHYILSMERKGDTVIAIGNVILKSTDFGSHWSVMNKPANADRLNSFRLMPSGKIWIAGHTMFNIESKIWESDLNFNSFTPKIDTGNSEWSHISGFSLDTVFCQTTSAQGQTEIYKTVNGGTSWKKYPMPFDSIIFAMNQTIGNNEVTYIEYKNSNEATVFYSHYINHVFYTNNGFQTIQYDTLLQPNRISGWFHCANGKEYLFHSVVDGGTSYLMECSKSPGGKLITGEKIYFLNYCNTISFSDGMLISGCEGSSITTVSGLCNNVGIINDLSTDLYLYPNPATNSIHLKNRTSPFFEWSITDIRGMLIRKGETANDEILVNDLPQGIYLVKIKSNTHVLTQKIMKIYE